MLTKNRLDVLALGTAILSLAVSAAQFYWSSLREQRELKAVVLNYASTRNGDGVIADVVFINGGTREEIVAGADFVFDTGTGERFKASRPSDSWAWIPVDPVYLKPGSTAARTYRMQLKKDFFEGKETQLKGWPTSLPFARAGMEFLVVDPNGSVRTVAFNGGQGSSNLGGVRLNVVGNPVINLVGN